MPGPAGARRRPAPRGPREGDPHAGGGAGAVGAEDRPGRDERALRRGGRREGLGDRQAQVDPAEQPALRRRDVPGRNASRSRSTRRSRRSRSRRRRPAMTSARRPSSSVTASCSSTAVAMSADCRARARCAITCGCARTQPTRSPPQNAFEADPTDTTCGDVPSPANAGGVASPPSRDRPSSDERLVTHDGDAVPVGDLPDRRTLVAGHDEAVGFWKSGTRYTSRGRERRTVEASRSTSSGPVGTPTTRPPASRMASMAWKYVGDSTTARSPGCRCVCASRAIACWAPVVTRISSAVVGTPRSR